MFASSCVLLSLSLEVSAETDIEWFNKNAYVIILCVRLDLLPTVLGVAESQISDIRRCWRYQNYQIIVYCLLTSTVYELTYYLQHWRVTRSSKVQSWPGCSIWRIQAFWTGVLVRTRTKHEPRLPRQTLWVTFIIIWLTISMSLPSLQTISETVKPRIRPIDTSPWLWVMRFKKDTPWFLQTYIDGLLTQKDSKCI